MSTPGTPVESDFTTRAKTNVVPVARLIGFQAKEIAEGRATVTLSAGPQHANPMGTLHGGILCDIADAAMGMAFASTLAPKESFTTVELKINFFRPVWEAHLAPLTQRALPKTASRQFRIPLPQPSEPLNYLQSGSSSSGTFNFDQGNGAVRSVNGAGLQ